MRWKFRVILPRNPVSGFPYRINLDWAVHAFLHCTYRNRQNKGCVNPLSRRWLAILRSQPRTNHFAYSVPSYSLISDKTFCIRFLLAVSFSMYPAVMNTRFALTLLVFHFSSWGHSLAGDWKSDLPTEWGGHLFRRFCKPFSESSPGCWAVLQLSCCLSMQG